MATLYIMYGSATGNAEHIAKSLASQTPPAPFTSIHCDALEKFKKCSDAWAQPPQGGSVRKHGLLLVCSTTGNADVPENASRFARYIKRKTTIDDQAMKHVAFATLGLGDTNYDVFCGAAKLLDKKIEEAGGERIKTMAMADEATGLEDVVEPWVETILKDIASACEPNGEATPKTDKKEDAVNPTPEAPKTSPVSAPVKAAPAVKRTLDKNQKSESPLFILYGSATGNAEQIAKDLAATYNMFLSNPDAVTYFSSVVCCDLNAWRKQCLPIWEKELANGGKHGVVIVTSTTGNGEPPENAERFARWIKRKQTVASLPLQHVAFSVLGLGDTNYDVFCATGKAVDKQLEVLGGTRVKPAAYADEATGLEDVVDPWVASILLDISIGSQPATGEELKDAPVGALPPKPVPVSPEKEEAEEKKMDVGDMTPVAVSSEPITSVSPGVRTLCNILNMDCTCPLEEVDNKCLPKIGTSLSSCMLLTQLEQEAEQLSSNDDDRVTVSSASSSAIHYTLQKPFESSIRNARYLTATPTEAAQKAAFLLKEDKAQLQSALDLYTEKFPLIQSQAVSEDSVERNGKRVIELTLALPDDFTLEYTPGDSLGLIVENPPYVVEFVLNMLKESQGILPDQHVSIDNGNPMTLRDAISREIDLSSPLKSKRIMSSLSQHATNCEDRKALLLLASKTPEGERAFERFVEQQRLSVVDILKEFPSCQAIPLTALLGILPGIPPRYYSVSSSPLVGQHDLTLTVSFSVVDYVTPSLKFGDVEAGLRRKKGIATSFLEALASPFLAGGKEGLATCVKIFPKPTSEFRMPASLTTPMVLVGPGTGIGKFIDSASPLSSHFGASILLTAVLSVISIAPFMGFLQHRRAMLSQTDAKEAASSVVEGTWRGGYEMEEEELHISQGDASGLRVGADFVNKNLEGNIGSVDVFFGCRHEDHDWLYKTDMKQLNEQGVISNLYTAFSRDSKAQGTNGNRRKYVQDLMLKDTECAARLQTLILEKKASVYICGDGNAMAKDVQGALTEIIGQRSGGQDGGKKYVEQMKLEKRYLVDIWTS